MSPTMEVVPVVETPDFDNITKLPAVPRFTAACALPVEDNGVAVEGVEGVEGVVDEGVEEAGTEGVPDEGVEEAGVEDDGDAGIEGVEEAGAEGVPDEGVEDDGTAGVGETGVAGVVKTEYNEYPITAAATTAAIAIRAV